MVLHNTLFWGIVLIFFLFNDHLIYSLKKDLRGHMCTSYISPIYIAIFFLNSHSRVIYFSWRINWRRRRRRRECCGLGLPTYLSSYLLGRVLGYSKEIFSRSILITCIFLFFPFVVVEKNHDSNKYNSYIVHTLMCFTKVQPQTDRSGSKLVRE